MIDFRKKEEILLNMEAGYYVRSKPVGCNEGAITIGISFQDSICLVSQEEYLQSAILPTFHQNT